MKNHLHLTLSLILKNQDKDALKKVLAIRDSILAGLSASDNIADNVIYRCPENTIHHSVIDFVPQVELKSQSDLETFQNTHASLISHIKSVINKINQPSLGKIELRNIHAGWEEFQKRGRIGVALQSYPDKKFISTVEIVFRQLPQIKGFPKIKGFSSDRTGEIERFALNIVRIFREVSDKEKELFESRIDKINAKLKNDPISFRICKLGLVISDDYLDMKKSKILF